MRILRVLGGFEGVNPDFTYFEGIGPGFKGLVHIADRKDQEHKVPINIHHQHYPHPPLYPISYQGGAIIGVFMI
jgi:hypothetical protein